MQACCFRHFLAHAHALRYLNGAAGIAELIQPPVFPQHLNGGKTLLALPCQGYGIRAAPYGTALAIPDRDDKIILSVVFHCRGAHIGRAIPGIQCKHAQLHVKIAIGLAAGDFICNGEGNQANNGQHCRHPDQRGAAQRIHAASFRTIQPAPRTLRMMSLSNFRRMEWISTSTALLSTSSPQP